MADSKKPHFPKSPILNIFFQKFHGLVLELVQLIDTKGIDVALPICPWGCQMYAPKRPKNTKNAFFACFGAYVGQPYGHIGWATSMPFASFNPTSPRTNPWNLKKNKLRIGVVEKLSFFESAILTLIVFCFQNCSDLLWEKNVLVIENFFWNLRLKTENLQKFWDHSKNE